MKLVYVLPKYDASAAEHFVHTYTMLNELGKHCDLAIVIEKCKGTPKFPTAKHVIAISSQSFLPRLLETYRTLWRLRGEGYTKIYTHYSFYGSLSSRLVTALRGGTTYYWNCGLPHLFFKKFGQNGWLANKINDHWPLVLTLKLTNYLITGTERMKQYYHDEFGVPPRKILVVPNDIDLTRFTPKRPNNKIPTVFFVHHLSERKGAHYIVPIAQAVLAKTNARFIIAGDGPSFDSIRKLIKKHKLQNKVKLLGAIPNTRVMKYYAQSDVFLMPSNEEGMPRVLLEAQAMGVPFVASDVGGVRDIISDAAQEFVLPKGDIDAFAGKITALIDDLSLREKLSAAGLENVKKYDLPVVVKHAVETLQKH